MSVWAMRRAGRQSAQIKEIAMGRKMGHIRRGILTTMRKAKKRIDMIARRIWKMGDKFQFMGAPSFAGENHNPARI